jgi:hypothetical protein
MRERVKEAKAVVDLGTVVVIATGLIMITTRYALP